MADVYEMPVPKPPTDEELDRLAIQADDALSAITTPAVARQVIRVQAAAIRKLRVALAKAEAKLESSEAIRKIASDERVVEQLEPCPGSFTAPSQRGFSTSSLGRCSVCAHWFPVEPAGDLPGHSRVRHDPDPAV